MVGVLRLGVLVVEQAFFDVQVCDDERATLLEGAVFAVHGASVDAARNHLVAQNVTTEGAA